MSVVTPYDNQRRRLRFMETIEAWWSETPASEARAAVARATRLTPAQLVNIRKGKLKDLPGTKRSWIDEAFVAWVQRTIGDLEHELVLAHASARGVDPSLVAKAKASIIALKQLILEAETAAGGSGGAGDRVQ